MPDNAKMPALPVLAKSTRETEKLSPFTADERAALEMLADNVPLPVIRKRLGWSALIGNRFAARADVQEACHRQRRAYLLGVLAPKSLEAAESILDDDETPASTKAALSRAILAMCAKMEADDAAADRAPAGEMTLSELISAAQALRAELASTDAECIEIPQGSGIDDLF